MGACVSNCFSRLNASAFDIVCARSKRCVLCLEIARGESSRPTSDIYLRRRGNPGLAPKCNATDASPALRARSLRSRSVTAVPYGLENSHNHLLQRVQRIYISCVDHKLSTAQPSYTTNMYYV